VGQWFKLYRRQGLCGCLQINPGGKPAGSVIAGKALELQQKLQDPINYLTSHKQIHQWLQGEHGIKLSCEHMHRFVHRHLGTRLKVVRKSNRKEDAAYKEKYKKTKGEYPPGLPAFFRSRA
jgi:transposase